MADQTIDKLQVEVEATARGTAAVFKQLENQLTILKKAFDAIDTSKLSKIQKAVNASKPKIDTSGMSKAEKEIDASIKKIQQSMAGLKSYADKAMTGDKSAFSTYDKQSTSLQSTIDKLREKFMQLGNQAVSTKALEKIDQQIEETRSHLESLEAKMRQETDSGGAALSNEEYIKMQTEIQQAGDRLSELIAKQGELVNTSKAFHNTFEPYQRSLEEVQRTLTETTNNVQTAMADISNAQPAGTPLDALIEKLQSELPAAISKIQQDFAGLGSYAEAALGGDKSAFTSFERRVTSIQSAIDVVTNKLQQLEGAGVSGEGLESYRAALQAIQEQLGATSNAVQAAYAQMNNVPAPEVSKEADKAGSSMHRLASSRTGLEGLSKALSKIKDHLKGISVHGPNMGKVFKNILKYGFGIRSIYVLFRRLRKAVIESFGELQNSGAFFQTTRANIESLKASLTTLKFQFGAAFEPIFNAVAPALQTLINYLISVMNVISAFTAKLMGKSTYSRAVANMTALGGATGGAAKAQKELNKQLQGFDELNNLTTNNPSGGGGGGGAGDAAGAHYVEESVDSVLGDFGKQLADQIRAGDWEGVGRIISDKLSDAMEGIDWDRVYGKARGFGKGLADFLNGLINPRLFGNVGTTLANSINTAFEFLNSFGTTFDWTNFGTSLGEGISKFFQKADFGLWGKTVHTWIAGILDAGIALVDNTDWAEIGTKLGEFLENLDIPNLVKKLGALAIKIIKGLGEALLNLAGSGTAGTLASSIAVVLGGLVFLGKLSGLASKIMGALGATTFVANSGVATAIGTALSGLKIGIATLAISVGTFLFVGDLTTQFINWIREKLGLPTTDMSFLEELQDIYTAGKEGNLLPALNDMFTGPSQYATEEAKKQQEAGLAELQKRGLTPQDVIDDTLENIKNPFKGTFDISDDLLNAGGTTISKSWSNITKGTNIYKGLPKALDTINKKFKLTGKTQTEFFSSTQTGSKKSSEVLEKSYSDGSDGVVHAITGAREQSDNAWATIGYKAKQLANQFKDGFKELPAETETTFKSGYTKGTSQFQNIAAWAKARSNDVNSGFSDMPSNVSTKFGTAYTDSTAKWSGTSAWATGISGAFKNAFNDTPSYVSGKFGTAYTDSTNKFANTGTWAQGIVDTIKNKLNPVPENFRKTFEDARLNATDRMVDFRTWFNAQKFEKTATLKAETPNKSDIQNKWNEIAGVWKNVELEAKVHLNATSTTSDIVAFKNQINNAIKNLNTNLKSVITYYQQKGLKINYKEIKPIAAKGGILTKATDLIAGEAGTEAIVPLQNHTEWLGKMADMMVGEMVKPQHLSIASTIASPYSGNADASSVAEQNALLREEVQLLRQIAAKDVTISRGEVFDAVRKENSDYINRTGYSPLFS